MAVLETKGATSPAQTDIVRPFAAHNTLAIAGLNAVARAKASFQPRARPYVGNAATLLPPNEAYVVHGLVYYADGLGQIWTMGADGKQVSVARFPIGSPQQWLSFAVSPDGCQFAAAVLTLPAKGPPQNGAPFPTLVGPWKLETMIASEGGPSQSLHVWTSTEYPGANGGFQNLTVVGWDSAGPLVVVGADLGTQNVAEVANMYFTGGAVAHLSPDGTPGPAIRLPAGCSPQQVTAGGDITCSTPSADRQTISVVGSSGQVLVQPFSAVAPTVVAVGPAGLIAVPGQWRNGGASGGLPANFAPEGWIDDHTIFGRMGNIQNGFDHAAIVHLSGSKATLEDLGFVGDYVGMLAP
jgi:hypothetical protein